MLISVPVEQKTVYVMLKRSQKTTRSRLPGASLFWVEDINGHKATESEKSDHGADQIRSAPSLRS